MFLCFFVSFAYHTLKAVHEEVRKKGEPAVSRKLAFVFDVSCVAILCHLARPSVVPAAEQILQEGFQVDRMHLSGGGVPLPGVVGSGGLGALHGWCRVVAPVELTQQVRVGGQTVCVGRQAEEGNGVQSITHRLIQSSVCGVSFARHVHTKTFYFSMRARIMSAGRGSLAAMHAERSECGSK